MDNGMDDGTDGQMMDDDDGMDDWTDGHRTDDGYGTDHQGGRTENDDGDDGTDTTGRTDRGRRRRRDGFDGRSTKCKHQGTSTKHQVQALETNTSANMYIYCSKVSNTAL